MAKKDENNTNEPLEKQLWKAAEKWNISLRRVQVLCEQGRIKGAVRLGWAWAIPKDAEKPMDLRMKKVINEGVE